MPAKWQYIEMMAGSDDDHNLVGLLHLVILIAETQEKSFCFELDFTKNLTTTVLEDSRWHMSRERCQRLLHLSQSEAAEIGGVSLLPCVDSASGRGRFKMLT